MFTQEKMFAQIRVKITSGGKRIKEEKKQQIFLNRKSVDCEEIKFIDEKSDWKSFEQKFVD